MKIYAGKKFNAKNLLKKVSRGVSTHKIVGLAANEQEHAIARHCCAERRCWLTTGRS